MGIFYQLRGHIVCCLWTGDSTSQNRVSKFRLIWAGNGWRVSSCIHCSTLRELRNHGSNPITVTFGLSRHCHSVRRHCALSCFCGTSSLHHFLYRKTTCTRRQLRLTCFMVVRLILLQFYHEHVLCIRLFCGSRTYIVADFTKLFSTCISRQGRNICFNYYVTLSLSCVLRVSVLSRFSHTWSWWRSLYVSTFE